MGGTGWGPLKPRTRLEVTTSIQLDRRLCSTFEGVIARALR